MCFICGIKISYVKLIFICEPFEPNHFTCGLGISYVKTFQCSMWKENFMSENTPIPCFSYMKLHVKFSHKRKHLSNCHCDDGSNTP